MIDAPFWKKAILCALTFPVAMVVNAVRVALIALVGESFGAHAADTFHDYSGLITVVLGFLTLIFIAQEMRCNRIYDEIAL
jgi:exosortase/archaeosortase family protein